MKTSNVLVLGVSLLGLIGCEGMRETFGLTHNQPDEFMVSNSPELFMPDNFYALKEPTAKEESQFSEVHRNKVKETSHLAHTAVTGSAVAHPTNSPSSVRTNLDSEVVQQASKTAPEANSNIRTTLDKEAQVDDPNPINRQIQDWKRQLNENFGNNDKK